jgi:F0F1-type ATP synthase delta subunit
MKHPAQLYARALAAVLAKKPPPEKRKKILRNFLELLRKNNDERLLKKIVPEAERLILEQQGGRKIVLESARPLKRRHKELLRKILRRSDAVEEKVSPGLVAGLKITVNGETQFDGTLAGKLKRMLA